MQTLDNFLDQAWNDHAEQPAAVAERLPVALPWAQDEDGVLRLAALAHHVLGEHLGRWQEGLGYLEQVAQRGMHGAAGTAALARCQASLRLCAELADERAAMTPSDQCRVSAMAACNLAAFDTARAATLLWDAEARAAALPDTDPGVRSLAANSNGIAGTLQALKQLTPPQRALMLRAAQEARVQWERAGTWLEVERAEYRLARCWLAAGDAARSMEHALRCEAIVLEHGAPALELFFGAEALALSARALADIARAAAALASARQAFQGLAASDQDWCRVTLDQLNAH